MALAQELNEIPDSQWLTNLFALSSSDGWELAAGQRYFTTANNAVGGSGLGNSRVINPPPGVSDYTDTPRGWGMNGEKDTGAGVWWKEMLEEQMDVIHIRPGRAKMNSFTKFWLNAIDADVVEDMTYGWINKLASAAGGFIAFVFTAPFWIVGKVFQFARSLIYGDNANRYSYYYLAPAALLFWKTVDNVVNDFALRCGLLGDVRFDGEYDDGATGGEQTVSDAQLKEFIANMPGVITRGSVTQQPRIDTLTIAHRHTLMTQARDTYLKKKSVEILGKNFTTDDELDAALEAWAGIANNTPPAGNDDSVLRKSAVTDTIGRDILAQNAIMSNNYDKYTAGNLSRVLISSEDPYKVELDDDGNPTAVANQAVNQAISNGQDNIWPEYGEPTFLEKARNVARGGYDFFSIAVDEIESSSISITNRVGPSAIESAINGTIAASRGAWFSANGGNIGDGFVASTIEGALSTGKAFLNSLANGLVGGVPTAILGGQAYLDIPDTYQDSDFELNQNTYTFTSVATSSHPLSKLKMVFPHLVMMCATSPISAGPRGYVSPFLIELHHQGKCHTNLGMITSLEGEFGDMDGWDINTIPNKIVSTFRVANLSKKFHVPIDTDASYTYTDNSEFTSHMAMLAGTSLTDYDRSFSYNLKLRLMRSGMKLDRFFSASGLAATLGQGTRNVLGGPLAVFGEYINRK